MPDMLVKLYELPDHKAIIEKLKEEGIEIRRPLTPEKSIILNWIRQEFSNAWADECDAAFSREPVSCFIAVENKKIVGFACYDATYKDFFGPTGVSKAMRGRGVGKALLLACLHAMAEQGYGYAIIGGAGPTEFYAKSVGAIIIDGSVPGIYRGMLRE